MDEWAATRGCSEVVAQIGESNYRAKTISTYKYIRPVDFERMQREASLLVGHAGMGTILGALEFGKPLIIMPRLARYGEHRNDHQLATTRHFSSKAGIYIADSAETMGELLDKREILSAAANRITPHASPNLIQALSKFIHEE
ncbi:glycosyltransferase [Hydrocarboniphaga effusa]|uniref:glycosyltransferase n=1 Tax=Hydrocarboniphaga effusa TaxID=243629 RepID=UPI003BAB2496